MNWEGAGSLFTVLICSFERQVESLGAVTSTADSFEETSGDFPAVIVSTEANVLIEIPGRFPAAFVEGTVDILEDTSGEFPM